jgi:PAS domain S-box-containing protein
MFGWPAAEAIGQALPAFLGAAIPQGDVDASVTGLPRTETRGPRKDGREIVCNAASTVLRDHRGQPAGVLLVFRDVTFEHAAQQALRRSEERYRSVVAAMAEGVILQRADGTIDACNASAARILGLPQGQAANRTSLEPRWRTIRENGAPFAPEDHPSMVTLRTGRPQSGVVMGLQKPDGGVTWVAINTQPLRATAAAPPYAVIATFSDITGRRQAEADNLRLQREVLDTQRRESLSVLAGGIAHDFNNLLTSIMGSAELAIADINDRFGVLAHLEQVRSAGARAAGLCAQMLMYAGRHGATFDAVNVNDVVKNAADLLSSTLREGVRLELDLADQLPPVWGDPTHLQHLLINLGANASDAMANRPGTIRLRTRCEHHGGESPGSTLPQGSHVCLSVSDDGHGMSADVLSRAFEPFYTTRFAGRGLGLPAAQGIVRSHGGTISLKSSPGQGTQVDVVLPALHPSRAAAVQPLAPAHTIVDEAPSDRGRMVLVVDDEDPVRDMCRQMLLRLGFDSIGARTGYEAVAIYREQYASIGAVVLDLTMPGMNGYETLEALRRINPRVCVLLSSGYAEPGVLAGVSGAPVAAFLGKPFTLPDLQTRLGAALAQTTGAPHRSP